MSQVLRILFSAVILLELVGATQGQIAGAYVAIDHTTGYVLDSYKPREKRPVADLTKIATAKVVLDWAEKTGTDLAQQVVVPPQALIDIGGGNTLGLQQDDLISYRDLIYAMMMQSDNAAAETLAFYVGSALRSQGGLSAEETFVSQMNALSRQLGMERTLFINPHGLEPRKGLQPYSTASDMSKLAQYAMKHAGFRFYVSQKERKVTIVRAGHPIFYLLHNTNELVGTNGIDGVKTGRTAKAGDCVILSSQRDPEVKQQGATTLVTPRRIDLVVLAATDRTAAGNELLNKAWSLYDQWAAAGRPPMPSTR
jgi:serine-type D-Ala-D-Ala carboxypeptidase (penicillin-binding protein 5/6)